MAVRYVEIGQYPDVRREVRGKLSEILVATANPGTYAAPEDVTGCFLEMGTDGKWYGASVGTLTQVQADALVASGAMGAVKAGVRLSIAGAEVVWDGAALVPAPVVGPFASTAEANAWATANPGSAVVGVIAMVAGVQYTYGAGGWEEAGGGLTPYADYTTLSAQAPTVGKIAQIPRLCGNGYFALRGNGTRWEVCPGESIVRDAGVGSAGYDLTATGTAYVPLASYTIPAGLIGDGEEWEVDTHAMSLDVHTSGNDVLSAYIGGQLLRGSTPSLTAINQVCRMRGAFCRLSSLLTIRTGASTADLYSGVNNSDVTVDMGSEQTFASGFVPGAATNKMRLRHVCLRRIG